MPGILFVDDTDPAIQYVGWEPGPLSVLPARSFFNDTFHHLSAPSEGKNTGASVSFTFTGTEVVIGGTVFLKDNQSFSPQCSIDGILIPIASNSDHVGVLCQGPPKLSNGKHIIAITVPGSDSKSQLWVDFIHYKPSSMTSARGSLLIPPSAMALQPEWVPLEGDLTSFSGVQTNMPGAEISINATGDSFTWFGCPSDALSGLHLPPTNVTITIDGVSSQSIANNSFVLFDPKLNYGNHQISVTYAGSSEEMPLTFCGYTIPNNQPNQRTGHGSAPTKSRVDAGSIVGAVVGGMALGAVVVFAVLLFRRYRRRRQVPPNYNYLEPATYVGPPPLSPQMLAPARVLSWRRTQA